jgi:hypothetical protein
MCSVLTNYQISTIFQKAGFTNMSVPNLNGLFNGFIDIRIASYLVRSHCSKTFQELET